MYCLNCGSQMTEGFKFCISCGSKYEKSIVMLFVWAFGSSFNRNTKNYARAILIFALIMLVLSIVGYFTIWSNIQEIMSNMNLPVQLPVTD